MSLRSHWARKALAAAGVSAIAATAAAAPANAASLTQTYKCTYPLIGERALTVNIDAAIPAEWERGVPTPPFDILASAEADLGTYQGLDLIGANKISGVAKASSTVTAPNFTLPVVVPVAIPEVTKPAAPPLKFEGLTGQTPSLTFSQTGNVNITVDKMDLNIKAVRADGSAIVLPPVVPVDSDGDSTTFDVPCVLNPSDQNKTLQNTNVVEPGGDDDTEAPTAPGEPFITSFDDVTPTSINLSWGASTDNKGVAGYEIRYEGQTKTVGNVTQALIDGLEPGGLYEIDVRAFDEAGNFSDWSPAIVLELPTGVDQPPSKVTNVTGNATGETSVSLSWNAASDDVFVAGYEVFQDGVKIQELTADKLSTTVTGLTRATAYKFKVRALDAPGLQPGPFSDEITVWTDGDDPPTAPANLAGEPALNSVALTWDESTDERGVVGYDVFRNGVKVDRVTGTSKTVTGLTPSTAYQFKVQAIDTAGQASDFSDEITVTTLADTPPSKPAGLQGTPTKTSVALTWSASTDDLGVAGYDVYRNGTKIDTVTGTSKTVTGLTKDTAYQFKVQAVDTAGQTSEFSEEITVTTLADAPPSTPGTLSASNVTFSSVALSWGASTDDEAVSGYELFRDGVKTDTVTGTTKAVTGLSPNTTYKFKVRAVDSAGQTSAFGNEITVTTPDNSTIAYKYSLAGSSDLKNLTSGRVPLTGGIAAELQLATGDFTADLTLNRTRARLSVLGLVPVTADIAFDQSGKTVGTLKSGVLSATARFKIKIPKAYLFGVLPIAGSDACQTKSSSIASLRSTGTFFDPLAGGRLVGSYGISDLQGCGWLNDIISPLTKGGGNTIDITLKPAN